MTGPRAHRVRCPPRDARASGAKPTPGGRVCEHGWRREDGDTLVLLLHVQPGAMRTEAAGVHGAAGAGRLRIRLAAPAVDGRANAELLRFLAAAFSVPLRAVTLLRGERSRQKTVRIARPALRPDRAWIEAQPG